MNPERVWPGSGAAMPLSDYAQEMPVRVIAHMLGIAELDGDRFRKWIHEVLELGITHHATLARAQIEMGVFFAAEVAKRRARPGDDLITYLINARFDGRPLSDAHIIGSFRLC